MSKWLLLLLAITAFAEQHGDESDTTSTPRDEEYESSTLKAPLKGVYDETREAYSTERSETVVDKSIHLAQVSLAHLWRVGAAIVDVSWLLSTAHFRSE